MINISNAGANQRRHIAVSIGGTAHAGNFLRTDALSKMIPSIAVPKSTLTGVQFLTPPATTAPTPTRIDATKLTQALMLVAALIVALLPIRAMAQTDTAETDSDIVDTYIGIESPFRVICTSVNFGVWFVPLGDRCGDSVVDLFVPSNTTNTATNVTGGGSARLAAIGDKGYDSPLAEIYLSLL